MLKTTIQLGLFSLAGMASVAITAPAQALNIDFSSAPWESIGNVSFPASGEANLSTENGADATNLPPDFLPLDFQAFLELAPEGLDLNDFDTAFAGSALKRQVVAGDQISFDWNFVLDPNWDADLSFPLPDYAFIVSNGVVEFLATSSVSGSFSRTFASDGLFGIGVVDIGDVGGTSTLALTNADFVPIPTPAVLPGVVGMGIAVLRRKRDQDPEAEA